MPTTNNKKVALITGITGQDGAYLAEFLLNKGYEVHGIKRRSSLFNTDRIDHLYQDPHETDRKFILHHGDLTDSSSLIRIIQQVQPDEIYNLAAQSHVAVSFEEPEYTANADGIGALRILEAIRILGLEKKSRFYQASTSELYGLVQETPQKESTPFYPRSPYAVAKLYAYWITVNYREAYGIYACNGILFNHESPVRGETFVTRKITHVIPALIRRLHEARINNAPSVAIWATGTPKREFLYVDGVAKASAHLINLEQANYSSQTRPMPSHINVGTAQDITIKKLAQTTGKVIGYLGEIDFDSRKSDGPPRKRHGRLAVVSLGLRPGQYGIGIGAHERLQRIFGPLTSRNHKCESFHKPWRSIRACMVRGFSVERP